MESNPLVLTDPNLLAEFVRESEFKSFFEKRFASPPDIAALLFRDGALIDSFKGTQFSVGGLWEKVKGLIGGSHHYAVMLADLKPFQIQFAVKGMSKDNVEIAGTCTMELQLNPDKPSNILGLMSGVSRNEKDASSKDGELPGRKALSRFDVLSRIEPQFQDRVFEAILNRHNADEIRGNRGLQDQIQADMMTEAERICGDIGVMVKNASITWAMNAVEREQLERAEIERQQSALDYQLELMKREVARQSESTSVQIKANVDATKLEQASEDDLANMVLNSEVQFIDAREGAARRQEAEALQHEIRMLRDERAGKFENDIAEASHVIDLTDVKKRLVGVEQEIDTLERQHGIEMRRLESEFGRSERRAEGQTDRDERGLEGDFERREGRATGEYNRSEGAATGDFNRSERSQDATTDLGIDKDRDAFEQDKAKGWADQAFENLKRTGMLNEDLSDRQADRGIKVNRATTDDSIATMDAEARSRVAQLGAAAGMTPDQISALTASYSGDAAAARIAEVQARAAGGEKMAEVVAKMSADRTADLQASREHELNILKTGMTGATGVAYGAGGGDRTSKADGTPEAEDETVECPSCGKSLSSKARFCTGCGHQMRT
ncbi:zinc-ribbon domain-containing protein [Sphingomonas panacisoli]|uniref:Zinc-ribbon domain-containing protein n=1 Tax=Sphingomonas panacisoli TaxID=1813879 RepID=A0A5B8LL33_9SPHN|nr:zinc ribbon domain-containing protein [Sphingomonas panacisoli]QDZ08776.1 zinc-ribbon domain-containing protein [Sphingomonas panacisoli]